MVRSGRPERRGYQRALLAVSVLLAAGCNDDTCNDTSPCPGFAASVEHDDGEISWGSANDLTVRLNDGRATHRVVGGGAVFTPSDTTCSLRCSFTVKALHFELERVQLVSAESEIRIEDLRFGLSGPVVVADQGNGYVIPAGTPARACAVVDGERVHARSETLETIVLGIDPLMSVFTFDGSLPFGFRAAPSDECIDFEVEISGFVSARIPWDENPLCADIEPCELEESDSG